jgi:hypothetical protein
MKWKIKSKACNADEVSMKRQSRVSLLQNKLGERRTLNESQSNMCKEMWRLLMTTTINESQDVERDLMGSGMERGGGRISGP